MKNEINTRMYPACHSGDMQAINAGSLHEHINLQYKNVDGGKGKMVGKQPCLANTKIKKLN